MAVPFSGQSKKIGWLARRQGIAAGTGWLKM
jgi:hypothetical protein